LGLEILGEVLDPDAVLLAKKRHTGVFGEHSHTELQVVLVVLGDLNALKGLVRRKGVLRKHVGVDEPLSPALLVHHLLEHLQVLFRNPTLFLW